MYEEMQRRWHEWKAGGRGERRELGPQADEKTKGEGFQSLESRSPTTTKMMVEGGVTTQYDQKTVRLMRRSKASPDAAWVIYEAARSAYMRDGSRQDLLGRVLGLAVMQ